METIAATPNPHLLILYTVYYIRTSYEVFAVITAILESNNETNINMLLRYAPTPKSLYV